MDPFTALLLTLGAVALAAALWAYRSGSARQLPPPRAKAPDDAAAAGKGSPEPEPESTTAAEQTSDQAEALREGLSRTRSAIFGTLANLFARKAPIDSAALEQVEEALIQADMGAATVQRMVDRLREQMSRQELVDGPALWDAVRREAAATFRNVQDTRTGAANEPRLILIVGVNGAGKTTTIGKLGSRFQENGEKVVLAAGDTFRAAAVLQLEVWGRRIGCTVVKGKDRADPASVVFDAVQQARSDGADVVLADTAGRLHTKAPLMEELKKVYRTAKKALDGHEPDEILLVLDATTGQNAVQQAAMFREALPISGIVLTKLDGTAKGGVVLGIVEEHQIPVKYVGIGERVEDLREFDAERFVEALFSAPDDAPAAA